MRNILWSLILTMAGGLCGIAAGLPSNTGLQTLSANQRVQDRIGREVFHELVMLPQLTVFDHLAYTINDDTVTLIGQVRNAILKDAAESVVKHVEGVEHVVNNIEILPVSNGDERIRRQVARALFNDSRLFRYSLQSVPSIHIIVKRGHVVLEGVVDNETDKNTAGIRSNGVSGVFSVTNNLQVENRASR
jgi:hyperosmotically inducible protein